MYPKYDTQTFTPLDYNKADISKLPKEGRRITCNMIGLQTVRNYPEIELKGKDINKALRSYNKKYKELNVY